MWPSLTLDLFERVCKVSPLIKDCESPGTAAKLILALHSRSGKVSQSGKLSEIQYNNHEGQPAGAPVRYISYVKGNTGDKDMGRCTGDTLAMH